MRAVLIDPVVDQDRLAALLPLTEELFGRHEAGRDTTDVLRSIARLTTRIVSRADFLWAFGAGSDRDFAWQLLVDWHAISSDLTPTEMLEAMEVVCTQGDDVVRTDYLLKCLEINTGDARISDLIYWPDEYFGEPAPTDELSPRAMLEIALKNGAKPVVPGS